MTSLRARQINADIRNRDRLAFLGSLSDQTAVSERVQAEAVDCPYCIVPTPVHPTRMAEHMALYHKATLLLEREAVIERGFKTFLEVWQAFLDIDEMRLYEGQYATFKDYCEQRWQFSRQRGYQLLKAARLMASLSTIVDAELMPENEAQARALAPYTPDESRVILQTVDAAARELGVPRSAKLITAVGKTCATAIATGSLETADGGQIALNQVATAQITREVYESMQREKEHIKANSKRQRILATEATVHAIANEDDAVTLKIRLPKGTDMSAIRDAWFNHKPLFVTAYTPKESEES